VAQTAVATQGIGVKEGRLGTVVIEAGNPERVIEDTK